MTRPQLIRGMELVMQRSKIFLLGLALFAMPCFADELSTLLHYRMQLQGELVIVNDQLAVFALENPITTLAIILAFGGP